MVHPPRYAEEYFGELGEQLFHLNITLVLFEDLDADMDVDEIASGEVNTADIEKEVPILSDVN